MSPIGMVPINLLLARHCLSEWMGNGRELYKCWRDYRNVLPYLSVSSSVEDWKYRTMYLMLSFVDLVAGHSLQGNVV